MNMRPLIIGDEEKARAAEILAYSEKPKNHYRVGKPPPGDNPHHVLKFQFGYRAVFSYTIDSNSRMMRHLTVSVPGGKYPNVPAVFMIADLFGFTGWDQQRIDTPPPDWFISMGDLAHGHGPHIVVGQLVTSPAPSGVQ